MGYSPADFVTPVELPDQTLLEQQPLRDEALLILDEIVWLCREKNIRIVFCTIPWQGTNVYAQALKDLAEYYGCEYVNLYDHLEEMGLEEATDFSDTGHLNSSGAAKTADFLGGYLKEHFDLTDFRLQPDNLWERARNR